MKKTTTKLVLKRETIRTLDRMQLEGIRGGGGGDDAAQVDTGHGTGCPGIGQPDHKPAVGG